MPLLESLAGVFCPLLVVFTYNFHDLFGLFLSVDLLECDAVFPRFCLRIHLVDLEVDLYA